MVGVMDSSGNLVNGYVYDPFGNLFEQNESVANPWQYASGYLDSTTGLYHFGARYYDPTLGRWTQEDPLPGQLSSPDSLNPYLYVGDSPVNATDPSGKDCQAAIFNAFFAVVGVAATAQVLYNFAIAAILAASFFPFWAAVLLAGIVAYILLYASAYAILDAIDAALPQCGINFSFGY